MKSAKKEEDPSKKVKEKKRTLKDIIEEASKNFTLTWTDMILQNPERVEEFKDDLHLLSWF
jgi:hypothetical protein